jgi:NAD(P)H-hydrate epimerase
MRVFNREQMQEADRRTIEDVGIPSAVLMENAGRQVVTAMEASFESLDSMRVAILCGRGGNGGDGFVVARTLAERGVDVGVYLVGQADDVRGDARANLDALRRLGLDVVEVGDATSWELHGTDVLGADVIVDALVGTGLTGPLTGLMETIVQDVNGSICPVVAVDLPSGLMADRVDVPGPAIDATVTVTFGAPKLPLVLPPAEALVGNLVIAEIGIPSAIVDDVSGPRVELLTKEAMAALVAPRATDSHKGDYGRVLVIAGSPGKAGAAALAGLAALRSGAGLVTVATPASCVPLVAASRAELMTMALAETAGGAVAAAAVDQVLDGGADIIAVGPGLGLAPETRAFVHALVERAGVPLVLDADAVTAFEGRAGGLVGRDGVDLVITPHPGEMARLVGLSVDAVQANRIDVAQSFAADHRVHVVLKGYRTVVAAPDGRTSINLTGNPGMATAGCGDVLAGMIAGWFGQLLDADAAARLAVYLHGLAGDLAEADEGEIAMVAGDVLDRLGDAVAELTGRRRRPDAS